MNNYAGWFFNRFMQRYADREDLMHTIKTVLFVAALLVFGGCAVGPDFKSPDKEMPVDWQGIDNATAHQPSAAVALPVAPIAWWQTFNDPVLTRLVEQALAANLDLKIAESRVRQARAARTIAGADLWPQLDAAGSYTRSHQNQQSAVEQGQRFDLFQAGLDAAWELDIFGGTRRSVEAARASALAVSRPLAKPAS